MRVNRRPKKTKRFEICRYQVEWGNFFFAMSLWWGFFRFSSVSVEHSHRLVFYKYTLHRRIRQISHPPTFFSRYNINDKHMKCLFWLASPKIQTSDSRSAVVCALFFVKIFQTSQSRLFLSHFASINTESSCEYLHEISLMFILWRIGTLIIAVFGRWW